MLKLPIFCAKIAILLSLFIGNTSYANILRSGDVLLQPLKCWSCNLIEAQEESIYSHVGIYLEVNQRPMVLEAYGSVRLISLTEYLKKTEENQKVKILRSNLIDSVSEAELLNYGLKFVGLPYDRFFLWDNQINGKDAIYCSELLFKIFDKFNLLNDLKLKMMTFDTNPDLWDKYFRGETPRGELGISPEDFNKSSDFIFIGEL